MSQEKSPGNTTPSANGEALIKCGAGRDVITVQRAEGVVLITVEEDVTGPTVVAAATQAVEAGILSPDIGVLVDMTRFVGTIDWGAIHTVREMKVWTPSNRETARVGFLVRDSAFGSLVTLASALFPRASLRLFTDRRAAVAWLLAPA